MTENPTPLPSFGRALGQAARQIGKLHHRALADCDTDFPTWMLLTLLDEQSSPLTEDQLVGELDRRVDLLGPQARTLLRRSAAAGLISSTPDAVALTEAGAAHFARVYAHARAVTDAASEGIDPAALGAAVAVLLAAEERATSLLAS